MSQKDSLIIDLIVEGYTLEQAESVAEQRMRGDY